jgi:type III restriction enzyme
MTDNFFEKPILNSPYQAPTQHHELDADGQPTNKIIHQRRRSELITPVPKPKKSKRQITQTALDLGQSAIDSADQRYALEPIINEIRGQIEAWRRLVNPNDWNVSPETARLLKHWREHGFSGVKPFFCQIEAIETVIWLTEVAPKAGKRYQAILDHLKLANQQSNPELFRIAMKMATGAGKTTVMAMLIAWQTVNAARHPNSKQFSRGFLIVAPGITIKDRLRVLLPNDPDSYYRHREIVPPDMLPDIDRAKIVITNYHAFKLRERIAVSKGTRTAIEGWRRDTLQTLETEGQMLQRVMPELMA